MHINVVFDEDKMDLDIIDVPDFIGEEIEKIQELFFVWLYDESNTHGYLTHIDGMTGYSYGTDEFVEWLNGCYLTSRTSEKAKVISRQFTELNNDIPSIYF